MQCLQENVDMLMQLKLFMLDSFVQTLEIITVSNLTQQIKKVTAA